jgi:hypothetical protein
VGRHLVLRRVERSSRRLDEGHYLTHCDRRGRPQTANRESELGREAAELGDPWPTSVDREAAELGGPSPMWADRAETEASAAQVGAGSLLAVSARPVLRLAVHSR